MKRALSYVSKLIVSSLLLITVFNFSSAVPTASAAGCEFEDKSFLGIPTWYKYLDGEEIEGRCGPKINASEDALPIGLAVFEIALTIAGLVAVTMIFIGAFKYITSLGEPEKASGERKTVINALIGLAITLVATRVVSFIAGKVG